METKKALEGVRVADFGWVWAAPYCTSLLGYLGAEVIKIAEVKNTGKGDAWVRVKIEKAIQLAGDGEVDLGLVKLDIDTTHWTAKDGYYYYNVALKAGEVTAPIFTKVTFDANMGNAYQNATATVDVTAQAVQAANNGKTITEAAGWPNA